MKTVLFSRRPDRVYLCEVCKEKRIAEEIVCQAINPHSGCVECTLLLAGANDVETQLIESQIHCRKGDRFIFQDTGARPYAVIVTMASRNPSCKRSRFTPGRPARCHSRAEQS